MKSERMIKDTELFKEAIKGRTFELKNEKQEWTESEWANELTVKGDGGAVEICVVITQGGCYQVFVWVDGRKVPVRVKDETYANFGHDAEDTFEAIKRAVRIRKQNRKKNKEARERAELKRYMRAVEERKAMYGLRDDFLTED